MTALPLPFQQAPVPRVDRRAPRTANPSDTRRGRAARLTPAALRVPSPSHTAAQFPVGSPGIFVHEGARQALERSLSRAAGRATILSITDNRRQMIVCTSEGGLLRARLHHMFLDAPRGVKAALIKYLVKRDATASRIVGQFIEHSGFRIRASAAPPKQLRTRGNKHDLLAIYRGLNERYFGGRLDLLVTWGRKGHRRLPARATIKLGTYSATERLIRIHPSLDRVWVPRYFVASVLFHEMLHHVIPATKVRGRAVVHPPHFIEQEAQFEYFARARDWERSHLARLLRS